jgi:hypothetical protein
MLQKIGSFIFIIGLLAIVMNFFNYVPKLLMWIYNWGEGPAWAIKIGLVVVGAALWFLGSRNQPRTES